MKDALGLVEVAGLATAIQVADVMVKSANVTIIDIEKAKGSGWMTVKVRGDVGAVQAAVQAGAAQAKHCGHLIGEKVIPRPANGLDTWLLAGGGHAVLQGVLSQEVITEPKVPTNVAEAVNKEVETPAAPAKESTAKRVKATSPEVAMDAKADETKSALLEVFKPGSTAKGENNTNQRESNTTANTSTSVTKSSSKRRSSRTKSTKPKA